MKENMSIVKMGRGQRDRFAIITKQAIDDDRLSWGARGLLTYLLSKPPEWQISVKHLVKQSPHGQRHVYARLNELKKYGYATNEAVREKGTFIRWDWTIYETPYLQNEEVAILESTDEPHCAFADVPYADVRNATQVSNKNQVSNNKEIRSTPTAKQKKQTLATALPDNWKPSQKIYDKAKCQNVLTDKDVNDMLTEFILYWTDTKEKKKSWDATFWNHIKRQMAFRRKQGAADAPRTRSTEDVSRHARKCAHSGCDAPATCLHNGDGKFYCEDHWFQTGGIEHRTKATVHKIR